MASASASTGSGTEEIFLAFHKLASQRKMDLAMRGLDVPNLSIDEMFEEAERQNVQSVGWGAFLRQLLPSPRSEVPADAAQPGAAPADARRLRKIASVFSECCHGEEDVDVHALVEAGRAFVGMLESVGGFAALSIQEAANNLSKITAGMQAVGARGGSLLSILRAEVQSGIHGAGGLLKDPSAAMGVLWICRFLTFWEEVCLMRAQPPPPDGEVVSLRKTIEGAYKHTLLPYHGWVTEKAFDVAAAAAPDWAVVRPHFAPSDEFFVEDAYAFVRASQKLLPRIMAALTKLDLVDTRKSV